MAVYSEEQARAILDRAIGLSKADQCVATLSGSSGGNIRYALNGVSTSGHVSDADLSIEAAFGKRVGTATTNRFDDVSIVAAVRRAEELARLAPENPEFVPAIEPRVYKASNTFAGTTAAIRAGGRLVSGRHPRPTHPPARDRRQAAGRAMEHVRARQARAARTTELRTPPAAARARH